jgi:hypothetical protein
MMIATNVLPPSMSKRHRHASTTRLNTLPSTPARKPAAVLEEEGPFERNRERASKCLCCPCESFERRDTQRHRPIGTEELTQDDPLIGGQTGRPLSALNRPSVRAAQDTHRAVNREANDSGGVQSGMPPACIQIPDGGRRQTRRR